MDASTAPPYVHRAWGPMSKRLAPVFATIAAAALVAACVGSSPGPGTSPAGAASPLPAATVAGPSFEPVLPSVTPETPATTPTPDAGNVEELPVGPVLSIEPLARNGIRVTLVDRSAKAWRVVVAGTGQLANDRLEIMVETGDVAPSITATEIRDGHVVSVMDLSPFGDPTAAAGGCHATLGVCLDTDSFRLPRNGNGRLAVELTREDDTTTMTITGGTAGWPGEPFILGPWTDTDAFPWGPGGAG